MDGPDFKAIKRRLLRGGVAPGHVKRTIRELGHHQADLVADARSTGASPEEAAMLARRRLGSDDRIVRAVLSRPELKSWAHTWPWAIYAVAPLVCYCLVIVLIAGSIGIWLEIAHERLTQEAFFNMVTIGWVRFLFEHFTLLILHSLSVVAAAVICYIASQRDMPVLWPAIGVVVVLVFGSGLNAFFHYPDTPEGPGSFGGGVGASWRTLAQGTLSSVVILAAYLGWRRRHRASERRADDR